MSKFELPSVAEVAQALRRVQVDCATWICKRVQLEVTRQYAFWDIVERRQATESDREVIVAGAMLDTKTDCEELAATLIAQVKEEAGRD